jgi:hypothetical protein
VGKTLLAEALGEILPGCVVVKLGVHHARPEKNHLFFERGPLLGYFGGDPRSGLPGDRERRHPR